MARVETEAVILDITCFIVPGSAFLGVALQHGDVLLGVVGGAFFVAYLAVQYFRWRKQG